jgi:plastocyanin
MKSARLLPLVLISSLMLAVPASAEDASISVPDFKFAPKSSTIDVGDTVTWNFKGPTDHTATSDRGQAVKFDSGLLNADKSFSFTFTKPGKFTFHCQPHPFMKGSVTVGKDTVAKSFTKAAVKGSTRGVKATVTLKEDAKVTLSVKGPKRKSVTKSLKKGKRSVSLGKLKAGSYKATVVAVDAFKVKTTKKATVAVG